MTYYHDLRQFLAALQDAGKVLHITQPLVRETEIGPLQWLQYRGLPESQRKAFLIDHVTDVTGRRFEPRLLLGPYATTREVFALGMQCQPSEINEKWAHACSHPYEPVLVDSGPVQDVIVQGDDVDASWLPMIVDEPGFSGTIRTTTQFITKDPDTGTRNLGHYSAHLRGPRKMFFGVPPGQGGYVHWQKCLKRGIPLEIAVVIGATPNISYASSAKVAPDVDELTIAGGIAGAPVPLVKCRTVDLEVPATAEIVLEGRVVMDRLEPFTAYGDYPGYMFKEDCCPCFEVTCITHRKDPIFVTHLVGFGEQDANIELAIINEAMLYKHLKHDCGFSVTDVAYPLAGGGKNICVIQMKKRHASEPWLAMYAAMAISPSSGKFTVVVDEDVDAHDLEAVNWALSFASVPHKDLRIIPERWCALDPSARPPDQHTEFTDPISSSVLIDATRKFGFPPVGLPRRDYMERALEIWKELDLPELHLRAPWYGYELGNWSQQDREYADLIVRGEPYELGRRLEQRATEPTV